MLPISQILKAAGLTVVEYGVTPRPGPFAPTGVLIHHTAASSSAARRTPSLRVVIDGRAPSGVSLGLPGPLCQVLGGYDGVCHVITHGRANHAGSARATGPMPAGDGNALYVGWEIDYSGMVAPSTAQLTSAKVGTAAILRALGQPATHARAHRETSVTGKWDPGLVDMDAFRAAVAILLRPVKPAPAPQEDDDMRIITSPKYGAALQYPTGLVVGLGSQDSVNSYARSGTDVVPVADGDFLILLAASDRLYPAPKDS